MLALPPNQATSTIRPFCLRFDPHCEVAIALCHGTAAFAAANEPKQFIVIPGGDHNDPQTDEYYAALRAFLGRL